MEETRNNGITEPLNNNQTASPDSASDDEASAQTTASEVPPFPAGNQTLVVSETPAPEQAAEPAVADEIKNEAGNLTPPGQEVVPPSGEVPLSSSTPTAPPTATSTPTSSPVEPAPSNVAVPLPSSNNKNIIQNLLSSARAKIQARRQKQLEKILAVLAEKGELSNREIRRIIRKSSATTKRYLNVLEKQGKVRQIGRVGRGVYYELIR